METLRLPKNLTKLAAWKLARRRAKKDFRGFTYNKKTGTARLVALMFLLLLSACEGGSDRLTMTGTQKCTVTVCTNGDCKEVPCQNNP